MVIITDQECEHCGKKIKAHENFYGCLDPIQCNCKKIYCWKCKNCYNAPYLDSGYSHFFCDAKKKFYRCDYEDRKNKCKHFKGKKE